MNVGSIVIIIIMHFIGDWLLQSREMAINKSKDILWLFRHLQILSITILIISIFLPFSDGFKLIWIFTNLTCHGIQDWFIWRIAGKFLEKTCKTKEDCYNSKLFWDIVGLDGALHYCTYFLSYWCLAQLA